MRKCSEEQHPRQHTQTARHACHVGAFCRLGRSRGAFSLGACAARRLSEEPRKAQEDTVL